MQMRAYWKNRLLNARYKRLKSLDASNSNNGSASADTAETVQRGEQSIIATTA